MGKSLKLGTIAGIRIQVHWTFFLVLAWILFTALIAGKGLLAALSSIAFVLVLFGCVVLHELGHALAARFYGIPTRDITLLPIGGVARLERMPRKPKQELVVALAGPMVNVIIAAVLFLLIAPATGLANLTSTSFQGAAFLQQLMFVNIALVLFNLLPAFPMDGGRVVRALLAMFMDYVRATRVAAFLGQICAIGLGFMGLFNPMLLLVAAFIFFGAASEARHVALSAELAGFQVRDGMRRQFRVVPANGLIRECALDLLESQQDEFPVIRDGMFVGMVRIETALSAMENGTANTFAEVMQADVRPIDEYEPLTKTMERAPFTHNKTLPVTSDGVLIGLLDFRQVFDLISARARLRNQPTYDAGRAIQPLSSIS
jgi:Zn-dependent protease